MRYRNPEYRQALTEHIKRGADRSLRREAVQKIGQGIKDIALNYLPVFGYLPVSYQRKLKETKRATYGQVHVESSTFNSAAQVSAFSAAVGIHLNGFDIGAVQTVREGWAQVERYVSWVGAYVDPVVPWDVSTGFSEVATQAFFYTLLIDGTIRVGAGLMGKPLGFVPFEIVDHALTRISENSRHKDHVDDQLAEQEAVRSGIDQLLNTDRVDSEERLAEETWSAFQEGRKPNNESLLEKLGVPSDE